MRAGGVGESVRQGHAEREFTITGKNIHNKLYLVYFIGEMIWLLIQ